MFSIAVVEDSDKEADLLFECLNRYKKEKSEDFSVVRYKDAFTFLEEKKTFDLVFMDIMLPNMTGMEAATRMRKYNSQTLLIFVTNMTQFAIKSYEVDALDYILKPISYERVTFKLDKALDIIRSNEGMILNINDYAGFVRVSTDEVSYVEVRGHKRIFHTEKGEFSEYGSLNELEQQLKKNNFMRCNSCYLVNPKYIYRVNGFSLIMKNGEELKISQPKRKAFIDELTNYLGQGKCRS